MTCGVNEPECVPWQGRSRPAALPSDQMPRRHPRVGPFLLMAIAWIGSNSFGKQDSAFYRRPNLYSTAKTLGIDIDYRRLLKEFQSRGTLLRAFYYTTIFEDQEYTSIRPLIDWLDYNGFTVVTKPAKEFDDGDGRRKVELARCRI
jgi:hypothetical protein